MGLSLKDICYCGKKPRARLRDDFDEVDRLLEERYPGVYDVHNFLRRNGLRDALRGNKPTQSRGAKQIVEPTIGLFRDLATGHSPLMRSFKAVTVYRGMVYGNPESLDLLQGWSDDWAEKAALETSIGCPLSELEVATADASDLVKVAGSNSWSGGGHMLPKSRTTKDEHGEPVLKKRRDEGKKPATCTACGHKWPSKSTKFKNGGFIMCTRCGAYKAKYD